MTSETTISAINRAAIPLNFEDDDYDELLRWIGERNLILVGDASHGTHDFYRERIRITRRLIEERGFNAVAIEGDWPDAYRIHRFVRDLGTDSDALQALNNFSRFPTWLWRNTDVLAFVDWLHTFNRERSRLQDKVGFYGLDLYNMHASIRAVLNYLDKVDPAAAKRARYRYGCFDHYGEDPQSYGYAAAFGFDKKCEDEVIAQVVEMLRRAAEHASRDSRLDPEDHFAAEQKARLVQNAEHYYRSMFAGRAESWNARDRHMANTIEWLRSVRPEVRLVVWAHNSHLGDARATEMSEHGEVNLGQLIHERFGSDIFSIGFTTHSGEVTAASEWDAPAERKRVRLALEGSYESLFHHTGMSAFLLGLRDPQIEKVLRQPLLERAIGVIYRPETERLSHYFQCHIPGQFDAVIHLDRTSALIPLERTGHWETGEPSEAYPFAV